MANNNNQNKYAGLESLQAFLANLKSIFASKSEVDEKINEAKADASDKDVVVLLEAQKGIDGAVASAKEYTDTVASGKADASHPHAISDVSGLQSILDTNNAAIDGLTAAVEEAKADSSNGDIVVLSEAQKGINAVQVNLDNHTANTNAHITSAERTNWNAAKTTADSAQTRADSAYTLAESKVDSLSDLGITATATELNHVDGVTSNIQTQLDEIKSAKADWNQNDSTKLDYINNRPFYTTDPVDTTIAEGTIPANGMMQTYASINSLTLGETYKAVFDGTTYNNLVCEDYDGLPTIMNDAFMFAIQSGRAMAYAANGSASHTLEVIGSISAVVPLERKYIAEHIDTIAGEKVAGKVYTVDGEQVAAGKGAEVFNDYDTNIASGQYSHAECINNIASGSASHAEGYGTKASGSYSHAEGYGTTASESRSHAEGWSTEATGEAAHAEGFATHATGRFSHAEGDNSAASGRASHAEGYSTDAVADYSHAEGMQTNASSEYQHVQGKFNIIDEADTYAHIVGNGTSNSSRKNAHTLDWQGNGWFAGDIYVGGTSQDDDAAVKVCTELDLDVYAAEESVNTSTEVINADTLQGYNANSFRRSDWMPTASDVGAATAGHTHSIGMNPIASTSEDTVANWIAKGVGFAYFNKIVLNGQPTQRGFLVNKMQDTTVYQEWHTFDPTNTVKPTIYIRTGQGTIWVGGGWTNPALSSLVDYVTATGTSGVWSYWKFSSGLCIAMGQPTVTWGTQTQMISGQYRSTASLDLTGIFTAVMGGTCSNVHRYVNCFVAPSGGTTAELWATTAATAGNSLYSTTPMVVLFGKWK